MNLSSALQSLSSTGFTVVIFIFALSIIVTVHEYGHYIVGRWSGIKADVFSLGFGKPLLQWTDKRGTLWQIAAVPLGGYVKFAGDANAASAPDNHAVDELSPEEARHTMPGAPLWARAATVVAGPLFNFIFTAVILTIFVLISGQASDRLTVDEVAQTPYQVGLQSGDEIQSIAGLDVTDLSTLGDVFQEIPRVALMEYVVLRDGVETTVQAPHPYPVIVGLVSPKSAALDADLQVGDVITHADGTKLNALTQFQDYIQLVEGKAITLTIWRKGKGSFDSVLEPRLRAQPTADGGFENRWLVGFNGSLLFTAQTESIGIGAAILHGIQGVWDIIKMNLSGVYHMIVGSISACNLSGPVGIANTVSTMASQGIDKFINTVAVISTAIGLINLFPIPVLDGGHLVFYAYEALRGKPLPDRAVGIMMTMGLMVIASMMLLGMGADLFCK